VLTSASFAQPIPGSFDRAPITGFGNSTGIVTDIAPIRGASNVINQSWASAVDATGRIVLAGYCYNNNRNEGCLVRLLPDGQLDNGFGTQGVRIVSIGFGDTFFGTLRIDSAGKYLLGGECQPNASGGRMPCVFRFDPATNALDTSFGTRANQATQLGYLSFSVLTPSSPVFSFDPPARTTLLSYGWSLSAFPCFRRTPTIAALASICVSRVNDAGGIDFNFGVNGISTIGLPDENLILEGISVDVNNRAYIASSCGGRPGKINRGCVARLNENGALDTSFGANSSTPGIVSVPITDVATDTGYFRKVLIQPDAKILAIGYCTSGSVSNGRFCAARLNQNGTLDASFGNNGRTYLVNMLVAQSVADASLQPDGKIVIAGSCPNGTTSIPCVARLDANGALDPGFDSDSGVANGAFGFTELGNFASITSLALQADGKLLLSGHCSVLVPSSSPINTICAARLNGGPLPASTCTMDVDGDGRTYPLIDGLILSRVMLGMSGAAVVNGIQFTRDSTRMTWPQIRQHLTSVCQMAISQP
jgi:uncharacterized delta-60 repeat protein